MSTQAKRENPVQEKENKENGFAGNQTQTMGKTLAPPPFQLQTDPVQRKEDESEETVQKKDPTPKNSYADATPAQEAIIQKAFDKARPIMSVAINKLATAAADPKKMDAGTKALLQRHFHTTDGDHVKEILKKMRTIKSHLDTGINFEVENEAGNTLGYVYKFLFWHVGKIHIVFPLYQNSSEETQIGTIIHEVAHRFTGVADKAYVWQSEYATLSRKDAMNNADSYASFAMEANGRSAR
ncbi:MAG: hypothetical protein H6581_10300 [Bacteroidia bacterium]|nr:hypothetical protein [Bacteroidia bacterium]